MREEDEAAPLVEQQRLEFFKNMMTGEELASWIKRSIEDTERSYSQMASLPEGSTEFKRAAHSLKGTTGTFGLMRISQIAAGIEAKVQLGGETEALVGELKDAIAATREELRRLGLIND